MALDPEQQIISLLNAKQRILVTTNAHAQGDAIASALAFYLLLKKLNKQVDITVDQQAMFTSRAFSFLPKYDAIKTDFKKDEKISVLFDIGPAGVKNLTYKLIGTTLRILITPGDPSLILKNPAIHQETHPYDIVIAVDTPDLESLGVLYDDHRDFFYDVPIINIDHGQDNEHFGEINHVIMTAVSTTEIIFKLAERWNKQLIDADVATCLLAGIIAESKSFQTANITPKTLAIASELITLGGNRERIVEKLYRNKPINMLQLWGRALARLRTDPKQGLVWTGIENIDFIETNTSEDDLISIVDDLLAHTPHARVMVLTFPGNGAYNALVYTNDNGRDLRKQLQALHPKGSRNVVACTSTEKDPAMLIHTVQALLAPKHPNEEMPEF